MDLEGFLSKISMEQQRVSSHLSDDTDVPESFQPIGAGAGGQGARGGDIGCNNVALNGDNVGQFLKI